MNDDNNEDLQNEDQYTNGDQQGEITPTARNRINSAIRKAVKNSTKAGGKVVAQGARKAIVAFFTNPYVLIAIGLIIISAAAYFIIKESFSNNSISSSKSSIAKIAESDEADEQTKSLLEKYELNRSYLTATIKDLNRIYSNYVESADKNNAAYSVEDMQKEFGTVEVTLEEMNFQADPTQYFKPIDQRTKTTGTSSSSGSSVSTANLTGFLGNAKRIWQKIYNEKYSYNFSATPPYNNGVIDCSAYVSWVLSESGYNVGRLNTEGLKAYDWAKAGVEVIDVAAGENVVSKLQAGDILVRSDGGGAYGHTNITVSVENGTVWAYDCGDASNWLNSGGNPINATWFASGGGGGRAGKIIRIGGGSSSSSSSSSGTSSTEKVSSTSSVINSSAVTSKYPSEQDSVYVLPSQKRELYKHILMTEKYNFNMVKWKLYKAEGSGASRVLPSTPSDNIKYTVEPSLGLRFPSSNEKTADYFVQLIEPYLQTNLIPLSMYSLSLEHDRNAEKAGIARNAEFVYSIIKDAYSDITMNIYQIEHYTENWSHEEWNVAEGNYKGKVQCFRVPNNLTDLCKARNDFANSLAQNKVVIMEESLKATCPTAEGTPRDNCLAYVSGEIEKEKEKIMADVVSLNCSDYDHNKLFNKSQEEIDSIINEIGVSDSVTYGYYVCHATGEYEKNKETERIISSGNKTTDVLVSTEKTTDIEYKPYRVKAFDIVLEYEYNFEVYNTGNQPDSVSTSSTGLPDENISSNINYWDDNYENEAYSLDCADGICDGLFETTVGDYADKVDRVRVNTTKSWSDKLKAASDGFKYRKYDFDDVKEYIAAKEGVKVSDLKLSTLAENYYKTLDSQKKINRIDLINSTSKTYSAYISNLQSVDKHLAIRQKDLEGNYSILTKRLKEIQKDGVLPYIYGQTLGLNLKYVFDEDKNSSCDSSGSSSYGGYEWPLPNNHLVSALFGYTPLYESTHEGIDIWATKDCESKNVNVVAAKDGVVYLAEDKGIASNLSVGSGGYGNHIIIYHEDDKKYTLYGHLETGTFKVKTGERVKAGQIIAKTGSSGNSSAYHLHFNISTEPYSGCVDPLLYYNVKPTSTKYPEYSKLDRSTVKDFNIYEFTSVKVANTGSTSLDGFLFIGDSRTHGIETQLKALGNNITVAGIDSAKQSEFLSVVKNSSGTVQGQSVTLPSDVTGVSVALGVNEISDTGKLDELLDALLAKYPNKKIYVNSVFPVAQTYTYANASTMNSNISSFNNHIKQKCNNNTNLIYIDITAGLTDSSGYLKSEYADSAGLHLSTNGAKQILVNNIKNGIASSGKTSSSSAVTNVNSAATEISKVSGVGTQTNLDAFKNFKEKYWNYITKWADAYEIDPYVILAIMAHESGFGVADENYKDFRVQEGNSTVYGLLQLTLWNNQQTITNTAKDRNGNTFGTVNVETELLGNAELQVKLCCAIMKDNLNKQDNKILPAIVAYNWGPNNKISVETALSSEYLQRIAKCYDLTNSGTYSTSLSDCLESASSSSKTTETISLTGSYVGEGKVSGNDQTNQGYFTNAGGTKYHTYNQSIYGTAWANNGAGPTACAIVLSGLTDKDRAAPSIFNITTDNITFEKDLIPLLTNYKINTDLYFRGKTRKGNYNGDIISTSDKNYIKNELAKGNPIIIYLKPGGKYKGTTYNGHYMAILGIKGNGDVYVADPTNWGRDGWISLDTLVDEGHVTAYLVCSKGEGK